MDNSQPPYLKQQLEYYSMGFGVIPGLYHSVVLHDDICNILKGKPPCNCNSTVLPPMTDSEYQEYLKKQK